MWRRSAGPDAVIQYTPEGKDRTMTSPAKPSAQKPEEVDKDKVSWAAVCFMQLLAAGADAIDSVTKGAPKIFLLTSSGAKHFLSREVTAEGPLLDDVETPQRVAAPAAAKGSVADITIWLLAAKESNTPEAEPKAHHERPGEGVIAHVGPIKNLLRRGRAPRVEVAKRLLGDFKFGSRNADVSSIGVDVGAPAFRPTRKEESESDNGDGAGWLGQKEGRTVRRAVAKFASRNVVQMPPSEQKSRSETQAGRLW